MKPKAYSLLLCLLPLLCLGQLNEIKTRKIVLEKGIVGKTVVYGKFVEYKTDELQLTYLGILKSKKQSFKIMKSLWLWGAGRATSRILIYNMKNKYLGEYYMTMSYELPTKIKDNQLEFKMDSDECGKDNRTYVSFKNGIPKHLILNCSHSYLASTFESQ